MARTLSPQELEDVRLNELAQDRRPPLVRAGETVLQPHEGQLKLYDPKRTNLKYGPGNEFMAPEDRGGLNGLIVFGEVEEHVAIVPADHPLLPKLRREMPWVVVLEPGEQPGRVYSCETCDQEFPSKRALNQHRAEAHPSPKAAVESPPAAAPKHRPTVPRPAPPQAKPVEASEMDGGGTDTA